MSSRQLRSALRSLGSPAPRLSRTTARIWATRRRRTCSWTALSEPGWALLYNLDLDRGPTPSGQLLYPVPLDDPKGQTLTHADMRLRTDIAFVAPGGGVAAKMRLDILDNVALGSRPDGIPSGTTTQRSPDDPIRVKRVWGEALTPFGVLAVGRMGSHWGLGMLTNSGDCADCDSGDAADRIAFVTPLVSHLWAVAYDFSATGPFVLDRAESRFIDIAPDANVHTLTFAFMRHRSDWARERRSKAGKHTVDYGAYVSRRWQKDDVPAGYLPTATPIVIDEDQVISRGYTATAADIWLRWVGPWVRVEFEGAYLNARVDQPSLIPGVVVREPATSDQFGAALQSEFGKTDSSLLGRVRRRICQRRFGTRLRSVSKGRRAEPRRGRSRWRPGAASLRQQREQLPLSS